MTLNRLWLALVLPVWILLAGAASSHEAVRRDAAAKHSKTHAGRHAHQTQKGKASYYGSEFYGKKMASGKPMNPHSNVAASKTLPLGTKAKVTNLATGKSATVVVEDRGPYVKGRVIDVTPKTADKLGLKKKGVAPVEVEPLSVPNNNGAPKTDGAAAADEKKKP